MSDEMSRGQVQTDVSGGKRKTVTPSPALVTLDPVTHRYSRGLQELASVTRVIRETWPVKPDYSAAQPDVLENARDRGIAVDALVSAWLIGELHEIPVGTREDAVIGFKAVREWWEREDRGEVETQKILADDEIAGTADIVTAYGWIWDLKCVSKPESTYELQIAAYLDLSKGHEWAFNRIGLIHCKFSKDKDGAPVATVKPIVYEPMKALSEWRLLRQFWTMVKRRTA